MNPLDIKQMDPIYTNPDDIGKGAPLVPDQMYNDQFKKPVDAPSTNPENNDSCKKKCNEDCDKRYEKPKGMFGNFFETLFGPKNPADQKQGTTGGGKKRKSKSKSRK